MGTIGRHNPLDNLGVSCNSTCVAYFNGSADANNASVTTLGHFQDLSIEFVGELLQDDFTVEQIALAFITAMSEQALGDFEAPLVSYVFTDFKHVDNPVQLTMSAAVGAHPIRLVRKHLLWCLWQLPVQLFDDPTIWGCHFYEMFRGQNLYFGTLSNRNRDTMTLDAKNRSVDTKGAAIHKEDAPTDTTLNNSATPSGLAGLHDSPVAVEFISFVGDRLPKKKIFSAMLESLLDLASHSHTEQVKYLSMARYLPVWIFVICENDPETRQQLQMHHIINLLHAIAEFYISRHIFQELTFRLTVYGRLLALGCVTKNVESRRWCAGLGLREQVVTNGGIGDNSNVSAFY